MAYLPPADRLTHYAVGSLVYFSALPLGPWRALVILCMVAAAREAYGLIRHGEWSWPDFFSTLAGGLAPPSCYFLSSALLEHLQRLLA